MIEAQPGILHIAEIHEPDRLFPVIDSSGFSFDQTIPQ